MIFCNQCGNELPEGLGFCTECGAAVPTLPRSQQLPTMPINIVYGGAATARAPEPTLPGPLPLYPEPRLSAPSAPPAGANVKLIMIVIGGVALTIIVAAILITNSSSKSSSSSTANTSSPSTLSDSLQNAIDNEQFVTLTNDDAYTYYSQLKQSDPQSQKLNSIKSQVLPQLRSMGDNVIRQAASIQWKRLTERDWNITQRVYEWAHILEPNDKSLEARWKYAEAEVARLREDKYSAERGYQAAIQLDSSWALPQFSMGLSRMRRDRSDPNDRSAVARGQDAISYFKRAIELEPNWGLPYQSMGTAYYLQGDYDTAERYYRQAMETDSDWAGPHAWMGAVYNRRNMCVQAIDEYQRAIELAPNDSSVDASDIQREIDGIRSRCH